MSVESNRYYKQFTEQLLPQVEKPARYIGHEWNLVKKEPAHVTVRMALAFPDVYEIGASYLGFHILYELINKEAAFCAERVFSPWMDMERLMRDHKVPLLSLETGTPLKQFDAIGITLQHEMSYSNVLNLLDLSQIAIDRNDRGEKDPLVIGGGPCASNPEPINQAFDLILLGDGETLILEVLSELEKTKDLSRHERIKAVARLSGVYAPQFYQPTFQANGLLEGITVQDDMALPVKRRIDTSPALPQHPLVPYLQATHDRVTAQLFRGCARGCRFCQAGMIHRPIRERDPEEIIEQLLNELESTGYDEASLTSLSSGDYTQILPLVRKLMQVFQEKRVALSFPSLRLDSFKTELAETVRKVRKTGLTFAPEAGSERLRQVINKYLDADGFTENLARVFHEGWDLVKLYFMVGLPTETDEDIQAICKLVGKIIYAAKQAKKSGRKSRGPRVNLGINLFIPKAHTPFQWEPQLNRDEAMKRFKLLEAGLPKAAGFRLGKRMTEEMNRSYLEAVFARGDRRLWDVLKTAWSLGARFDSWGDQFKYDIWEQAFKECSINPDDYALRRRDLDETLPWDHLDMGVSKAYLKKEYEKSKKEELTPDCRQEQHCQGCGADDPKDCPKPDAKSLEMEPGTTTSMDWPEKESVKIRLSYEKKGAIRFVGHLDMANLLRRAVRRAQLPVHYSVGFHPQPSLGFGPPIPLGYEANSEWVDIGLDTMVEPDAVVERLNQALPEGLRILSARTIPVKSASLNEVITGGHYRFVFPEREGLKEQVSERLKSFWEADDIPGNQWSKKGTITINCRPCVKKLELVETDFGQWAVELIHRMGLPKTAKLPTLVEYFCGTDCMPWEVKVTRLQSGHLEETLLESV